MAKDLAAELGIDESCLTVLPNPLDVDAIRAAIASSPNLWTGPGPHLLAVGRLSREKGFDLLLQALAIVRKQIPNADLAIAGAGPEEEALKAECRDLGLEAAVRFAGHVAHPSAYFPGASAFVLSSRHEGLPNALLEAAAGGLPIAALPASEGVVDLLRGQPGAWLASEVSASALAGSLLEAFKSLSPGQRFDHSFIDPFRIDRAIRAYENLIDAVLLAAKPHESSIQTGKIRDSAIEERRL
jgi:glycosyltransferase involved in cell wall biosynthesis